MKVPRKLIATMAAFAMTLTLGASASFAASIGTGVAETNDTQITVPKGVTFINEDAVTSYGPGITYTYTVAPATTEDAMTVTDAEDHVGTVHAGPANGLTLETPSITFGADETYTTSAAGVQATKNIVMNVDLSKFNRAGIYRYVLTDTTAKADLYAAGITRDDGYDTTRFIDVFVRRTATGFEVYGYALKTANGSTIASTEKDPGFVSESPAEDGDPVATDKYKTYNVTLTKTVTGTLGDFEHEFPFAITVSNNGHNYNAAKGDINAAKAATATSATSLNTTLKHTQTYTIAGLSPHATVAYQETNDTSDLYEVSVAGSSSAISVTADQTAKTYAVAAGAVSAYDTENSATSVAAIGSKTNYEAVTYTNNLDEVSPTGLVLRFGAYAFLIALAFGMMFALNRRESVKDEI